MGVNDKIRTDLDLQTETYTPIPTLDPDGGVCYWKVLP